MGIEVEDTQPEDDPLADVPEEKRPVVDQILKNQERLLRLPRIGKTVAKEAETTEGGSVEVHDGMGDEGFDAEFVEKEWPSLDINDIVGVEPMIGEHRLPQEPAKLERDLFIKMKNMPLPEVQTVVPLQVPADMVPILKELDDGD